MQNQNQNQYFDPFRQQFDIYQVLGDYPPQKFNPPDQDVDRCDSEKPNESDTEKLNKK